MNVKKVGGSVQNLSHFWSVARSWLSDHGVALPEQLHI